MKKLFFLFVITQFVVASELSVQTNFLSEYHDGKSKSVAEFIYTCSLSPELRNSKELSQLKETIKNLVRSNDVNSDSILHNIDGLLLECMHHKPKHFPSIMHQVFSDASAFNWCLHATKGDMTLHNETDTKNTWRRLWLVIYDNFEQLLKLKFTEVTCVEKVNDHQKVLRCNGKNYKQDNNDGKYLTKDQVETYWKQSLAPRVYNTNINFINRSSINIDRDRVMATLLCIKHSKKILAKSAFKKVFKELIMPSVCTNIIQDLQKSWKTLYLNIDVHIDGILKRSVNKDKVFEYVSPQYSIDFFKNYATWFEQEKEATLKDNSLIRDFIYRAFGDTCHKNIRHEETIDSKKIEKKHSCVLY